jgi:dihydrofolate reductase
VGRAVLDMSMSVDGFIAGPNDVHGNGLGDGGECLHAWFMAPSETDRKTVTERLSGVNRQVMDEALATGAVVVGGRTFALADGWDGDHHDGVPIFVVGRPVPDGKQWPAVTYESDVAQAMRLAKDAAGSKDVLVHGARTGQLALQQGVLDEVHIHVVPVLLGQGRRLFENMPADHIELELTHAIEAPGMLHLRYRVRTGGE